MVSVGALVKGFSLKSEGLKVSYDHHIFPCLDDNYPWQLQYIEALYNSLALFLLMFPEIYPIIIFKIPSNVDTHSSFWYVYPIE